MSLISYLLNIIEYILNWISNIGEDINSFICLDDIDFRENKVDLYCMYFELSIYNELVSMQLRSFRPNDVGLRFCRQCNNHHPYLTSLTRQSKVRSLSVIVMHLLDVTD